MKEPRIEESDNFVRFTRSVRERKDKNFYVGMASRPGVHLLCAAVEYTNFHPNFHGNNELFDLDLITWTELNWMVFSIPKEYDQTVRKTAEALNMRIADGVPIVIDGKGSHIFPGGVESDKGRTNMFGIESGKGNLVYSGNQSQQEQAMQRQSIMVDRLCAHGPLLELRKIAEFVWSVSETGSRQ